MYNLNILSAVEFVFCEVQHKAKEQFEYLNIKNEEELLSAKWELRSKEMLKI